MNKEEFEDYIDTFKDRQSLSKEDIYEIGKQYKTLPNKDKKWDELASLINWGGTGASLRSFINYHMRKDGTLPINPSLLSNRNLEESTTQEVNTTTQAMLDQLYIKKTQIRDTYNAYRRGLRDEARIEDLKTFISEIANNQAKLPKLDFKSKVINNKSEAILMFSDWHIGQDTENFYNKYNADIAKNRINDIVDKTISYCKQFSIKTLNVLNLGDLIEGIINPNARIDSNMDASEQFMVAAELLAEALCKLQLAAPVVTYRSVVDNHSRYVADKHQNIAKENMNRLVDFYLKARLQNQNIQFINDNLDIGLGLFTLDNQMKVGFSHGHEDSTNKIFQNIVGATQTYVHMFCMGHLHNPAEHTFQNMRVFVNGSLCGTGPYALSNRLFTKPSQKLIVINNNDYIDIDINTDK